MGTHVPSVTFITAFTKSTYRAFTMCTWGLYMLLFEPHKEPTGDKLLTNFACEKLEAPRIRQPQGHTLSGRWSGSRSRPSCLWVPLLPLSASNPHLPVPRAVRTGLPGAQTCPPNTLHPTALPQRAPCCQLHSFVVKPGEMKPKVDFAGRLTCGRQPAHWPWGCWAGGSARRSSVSEHRDSTSCRLVTTGTARAGCL